MPRNTKIIIVFRSLRTVWIPFMEKKNCSVSWIFAPDIIRSYWKRTVGRRRHLTHVFGSFQWIRLPMGLCTVAATFQRAMTLVLQGLEWEEVIVYLDDVMGTNFSDTLLLLGSLTVSVCTIWNWNTGNATFSRKRWSWQICQWKRYLHSARQTWGHQQMAGPLECQGT